MAVRRNTELHAMAGIECAAGVVDLTFLPPDRAHLEQLDELKQHVAPIGYRFLPAEYIDPFFTNPPDIG